MEKKFYYWLAVAGWGIAALMGGILIESIIEPTDAPAGTVVLGTLLAVAIGAFGAGAGIVFMRLYRKSEEDRPTNRDRAAQPQPPDARRF